MQPEIDPKTIKRKIYMSYFQDGLWDILLGFFLLSWGVGIFFDQAILPTLVWIALFPSVLALKRKVTYPRIGYSRPAEHRKQMTRIMIAGAVTLLLGIIVFLLVFADGMTQFLKDYFEFLFGSMLSVVIALIGYWWNIVRWFGYAILVFICATINQWSGLSFEMSFIIPGGIVILYGLFLFVRFIHRYPVIASEEINGNGQ